MKLNVLNSYLQQLTSFEGNFGKNKTRVGTYTYFKISNNLDEILIFKR